MGRPRYALTVLFAFSIILCAIAIPDDAVKAESDTVTSSISNGEFWAYSIKSDAYFDLTVEIRTTGDPVNVIVMDREELDDLKSANPYLYYTDLSMSGVTEGNTTGRLPEGSYVVAVMSSIQNGSATFSLTVDLDLSDAANALMVKILVFAILMIVPVLVLVIFISKKKGKGKELYSIRRDQMSAHEDVPRQMAQQSIRTSTIESANKTCGRCNNAIEDSDKFCTNCGNKLK